MGEQVRVCGRDDLSSGQVRRFDVGGHRVALVRVEDDFYAVADMCSHEDFPLSDGEVWCAEREIECSRHGSTFSLLTGEPQSLPATKPVQVFGVVVEGGDVSVVLP